jgi:SAM-dependent methyltransferase
MARKNIYTTNEYIKKNPTLHKEDSPWKVEKIIPLIDVFIKYVTEKEITILDVGGGAGLILRDISTHMQKKGIKVKKYALDLSPEMLKIQKKNNPDIMKLLNEDIKKTSLKNKEIDLVLMIDVLEHVPDPEKALKELRRISKYVIFKVPLGDNLCYNIVNYINHGKLRKESTHNYGHVNFYNYKALKKQIEQVNGKVIYSTFTNFSDYFLHNLYYSRTLRLRGKVFNWSAKTCFYISPRLSSYLFFDFSMILCKSYDA